MEKSLLKEFIEELWKVRNPHTSVSEQQLSHLEETVSKEGQRQQSPLVIDDTPLSQKAYFDLTTARNRHLITEEEQVRLAKTTVAFFGLSVGSHAALTWLMESRADTVKLADPDTISATNLNRLRFGIDAIGKLKTQVVTEQALLMNPFVQMQAETDVSHENVTRLLDRVPKTDIIVDEIDNFADKIFLRKYAKAHGIPLVSAADIGDNVALDIERYDTEPNTIPFLGRVPNVESVDFAALSDPEKRKLIINLVGFDHNSFRMLESLQSIGGSIVSWPQLGATATIAGGVIATILKKIVLGEAVQSGRYYISLDRILIAPQSQKQSAKKVRHKLKELTMLLNK